MTMYTGGSTGSAGVAEPGEVPAHADGVLLLGEMPGSGYRRPPALVRRADGQTIQLTRLLYLVLAAVDGRRTYAEIAAEVSRSFGRLVAENDVRLLVDGKLRPMGVLRRADGAEPETRRSNPLLALRFRLVVADPAVTRRLTAPFTWLFSPPVVVVAVTAFAAVCVWLLAEKGLASATHQAFRSPAMLLAVFALTVVSAGFHEFGHAAAARRGGATPGAMGAGLYLVWPAFYTDVTDSYRLGRAGRVRTDLGGLYFNALVALATYGVWWATGWDALLLVIVTQVLQMVRQLAPLVRFDGYHVLADVTGVPDLYAHIKPTLLGLLPTRWRSGEQSALKPWARAVICAWVLVVVPLLLLCLLVTVLTLPRIVGTALASLERQWTMLGEQLGDGDLAAVLVRILSMVAIAVPLLGIAYILFRLARQVVGGTWRATRNRPVRRAVAGVVAAALLAGVASAWWPSAERYRPVQPYERGTLLDAVPVSSTRSAGLQEGSGGNARVVWPASGTLPSEERPELALVLVPRGAAGRDAAAPPGRPEVDASGSTAPTWVLPFNRPSPPGEGDNQALAVNTGDGSVVYDVAFALVWADEDTVLNRNEAYALASCRDCRTVAVAFQVVLVVGQADVVVPQNISAAVNYGCLRCVTYALAQQLVVTLPENLGADTTAALTALWQEIAAFGAAIRGVPLAEIQKRLTEYEARILELLRQDPSVRPSAPASSAPTEAPTGSPDEGRPTEAPPGQHTVAPVVEPTGPDTADGQEGRTAAPSPSPSETVSATPTAPAAVAEATDEASPRPSQTTAESEASPESSPSSRF